MNDREKLNHSRLLFERGEYEPARKQLELITTREPNIRLEVLLTFLVLLDHVTENDKLLAVADEGIELATLLKNESVKIYLLGKRCSFLVSELSNLSYRKGNLILASRLFGWIGFSLEVDKKEYEEIEEKIRSLEMEIDDTLRLVLEKAEGSSDHMFRGHIFSTVGDIYSQKYFTQKLIYQNGGRFKSKIANIYYVRRWNIERYLYTKEARIKIDHSSSSCIQYFKKSIDEFSFAGKKSEQAYAIYNLAVKYLLFNNFQKAKKLLSESRIIANSIQEKRLLAKIDQLELEVADKNRHVHDYVGEAGLDLPRGVRLHR